MLPNHSAPSKLPQWAYWAILILIIPAGAGSIYLTREYSFANLTLLQLDDSSRAARKLSIDVLLFAHVVAFFVGPVLFDTRLKWRRRQLLLLGFAIWLFDCAALYQSRVGIMISADSVQTTTADKAKKKQENIESMRRQVLSLQKLAETQLALNRVKAATATTADATELEKKANDKAAELDDEPTSTGLTEVKVWGAAAPYKAFVESLLISFTTLVMLGMQGAIVRVMLERVTPDIQQAATNFSRPENALLKRGFGRMLRGALAALGVGAAAATATAGEAPVAPPSMQSQPVDDASQTGAKGVNDDTPAPVNVDTPSPATPVIVDTPPDAPDKARKARQPRVRDASSAVMDTGVGPNDGYRYRRALAAVKARQIRPSLDGLSAGVQASAPVARRYLAEMAAAGEIVPGPGGRGWVLATKTGGAK